MSETEQIVRQLDILREFVARHFGITVKELAEEYNVHKRTIQRDLNHLLDAGFLLVSEQRGRQNYWKLDHDTRLPPINFPDTEVIALIFVEGMLGPLEGTPFKEQFHSTLNRIRLTLPEKKRAFLDGAASAYFPHARGQKPQASPEIFEVANRAIADRKVCRVTYHAITTDQTKTYPVEPLRFFYHHGGMYLLCWNPAYNNLITLAAERILALEVTSETFEISPDLNVEDYIQHAFGVIFEDPMDVKVRFSPSQAPYIRQRVWHPSQEIEELRDGAIIISFHAGGFFEIKSWVLSYGSHAEVLQPACLREEIINELREISEIYKKK